MNTYSNITTAYRAMVKAAYDEALVESAMEPELDEALKQTLPTKENKVRLEAFMKKLNALRNEFPDVVIHGTHDEKVEARLLGDDGNVVQYLGMKIDFVHKA
jgi:predicted ester cyclase